MALTLQDPLFYPIVSISSMTRGPIEHIMNFFQQKLTPESVELNGGHLAVLQQSKGKMILDAFDAMLDNTCFVHTIRRSARLTTELETALAELCFQLVTQGEASLERRILSKLAKLGS